MSSETAQYKATILEQKVVENTATLLLQVDPEITYFQGHFENYPLLAGVVQIDWAIYYGKKLLSCDTVFAGMEVIKFQQPILPNYQVLLTLRWEKEKQKLYFSYTADDEVSCSSGRIKLDATK
ncbi:3-hydroxyacyl-ACP dehydratase [Psychromonas sp. RZ22]|uniref:ApeI family dehydratase n=1 Tax=Psychromonas algarum TaxID=2555643 RepID=UPI0010684E67|nr:3-hydroxyacyl-ACP dehydratase [Psychromonas sp. RZ22]TEW54085.1 3-hydroxyacyl-ACP dehydratase [Psychromonas sp. RZ22]